METTKNIQHLLFRTIDGLGRKELAKPATVRQLLVRTALEHIPFAYDAIGRHIEMLIAEYCRSSRKQP
jgi:hypothetical protein